MGSDTAEQQLQKFLETPPPCLKDLFLVDSMSPEEKVEWHVSFHLWLMVSSWKHQKRFEKLLKRCGPKWNEYCKRRKENALRYLPSKVRGRPAKNALAEEAIKLKKSLSYPKVVEQLNQKYGPGTTTEGAIRQLIKSRRPSDAKS